MKIQETNEKQKIQENPGFKRVGLETKWAE